jgi:hypothetical protein
MLAKLLRIAILVAAFGMIETATAGAPQTELSVKAGKIHTGQSRKDVLASLTRVHGPNLNGVAQTVYASSETAVWCAVRGMSYDAPWLANVADAGVY